MNNKAKSGSQKMNVSKINSLIALTIQFYKTFLIVFITVLLITILTIKNTYSEQSCQSIEASIESKPGCDKNQQALNECSYFEWASKDKELNDLYQKQILYLNNKKNKESLVLAQQAWIKFRDSDCLYQVGSKNLRDSIAPYIENTCKYKHTLRRIEEIKAYLQCRFNGCLE